MSFSVDNVKMIRIIIGSTLGVVGVAALVLMIYSCRVTLTVYRRKRRKKVPTVQEQILRKEGATGVEKLDCPGLVPTML